MWLPSIAFLQPHVNHALHPPTALPAVHHTSGLPSPSARQGGAVRPPPGSPPPGSFTVLLGEHAGRTFEATPGREREVAAARQRMWRGVMDAHVFAIMRLRQSHLLSALLALSDSYMMNVLGREGALSCLVWQSCEAVPARASPVGIRLCWF